ncbi:winged helix-turn-helix transcriptional regulator [Flaviflexus huanghaiensis]|uniref:winged helix-turn-helix transcriptional regulator n=1 Tax=Flaviflexus huanghaiensis TaxID=1111473 RepID=UPI0015FACF49|nr:helix-turn-helix domain-containing protein [Flaviflexus huanghaiensis]
MAKEELKKGCPDIPLAACKKLEEIHFILGKRWTGPIVDTLRQRPAHFNELSRVLEVSRRTLSARLKELVSIGVVERTEDDGEITYTLTPAGEELLPSLDVMREWAIRHLHTTGA